MPYIDRFLEWLNLLPPVLMYIILGVSAFVENVFPPIPGDTITAFGAFLVGTHQLRFLWVYTATTVGSIVGFCSLFWMGTCLGRAFFLERDYRFFKAKDILKAESWFRKYGYLLILLNRFFPGIRSAIAVAGGITRLGVIKVTILAFISCSVWNLIWIWVGYSLGTRWDTVKEEMSNILVHYNVAVAVFMALVLGFLFLKRRLWNKK